MKLNSTRLIVRICLLSAVFLGTNTTNVSAKTDLFVDGNVLGYKLYTIKPISNVTFPVLFKTTKIRRGVEKFEYIIVFLRNLSKEYAEENFGLNKTTTFNLQRQSFCDTKIKNLFRSGETIENGEIVKTPQTLTLAPGVVKESLPLNKKIPCYIEVLEN